MIMMADSFYVYIASVGNVCTVRCRNAQDFGGCVAVQQTDVTPSKNDPSTITSAQTLAGIQAQIQQNKIDLAAAVQGNQAATQVNEQGVDIAQAILNADPTIVAAVQKELQTNTVSSAAAAATTATNTNTGKKGKGNGNANANAGNTGNANAAKGNGNAAKGNGNAANANAANGNANAATGNAAKGNGNAAAAAGNANANAGNANANAATGQNRGGNNNNNNKRESLAERRKRYVNAGVDYAEEATGN